MQSTVLIVGLSLLVGLFSPVNTTIGAPPPGEPGAKQPTFKERLEADPIWWVLVFLGTGCAAGWSAAWWFARRDRTRDENGLTPGQVDEDSWLDSVVTHLTQCQEADIYLRYFRDPDADSDPRLEGKRERVRLIMVLPRRIVGTFSANRLESGDNSLDWRGERQSQGKLGSVLI